LAAWRTRGESTAYDDAQPILIAAEEGRA
jgi:hypothetical protein